MVFSFSGFFDHSIQQHSSVFKNIPLLSTILGSAYKAKMKSLKFSTLFHALLLKTERKNVLEVFWIAWKTMVSVSSVFSQNNPKMVFFFL